jgi:hypothetical protein
MVKEVRTLAISTYITFQNKLRGALRCSSCEIQYGLLPTLNSMTNKRRSRTPSRATQQRNSQDNNEEEEAYPLPPISSFISRHVVSLRPIKGQQSDGLA